MSIWVPIINHFFYMEPDWVSNIIVPSVVDTGDETWRIFILTDLPQKKPCFRIFKDIKNMMKRCYYGSV